MADKTSDTVPSPIAGLIEFQDRPTELLPIKELQRLLKAATRLAKKAARQGEVDAFCNLMKVIQAQQRLELSENRQPVTHLHAHAHTDGRRSRISSIAAKLGVPEASDAYFAE